ncbi:hypothetical protein WJ39_17780 [Burkholderia diffusa]|nr:hypothetical protein WJ39_17780 [Burkholderia diffusa]
MLQSELMSHCHKLRSRRTNEYLVQQMTVAHFQSSNDSRMSTEGTFSQSVFVNSVTRIGELFAQLVSQYLSYLVTNSRYQLGWYIQIALLPINPTQPSTFFRRTRENRTWMNRLVT